MISNCFAWFFFVNYSSSVYREELCIRQKWDIQTPCQFLRFIVEGLKQFHYQQTAYRMRTANYSHPAPAANITCRFYIVNVFIRLFYRLKNNFFRRCTTCLLTMIRVKLRFAISLFFSFGWMVQFQFWANSECSLLSPNAIKRMSKRLN